MSRKTKNSLDSLIKSLTHSKRTILLIVGVAIITFSLTILISVLLDATTHFNFPSLGTIHTIGVKAYYDPNLENMTTQIEWGKTYPGSTANVTLYIKSISNTKTALHLQTANWAFRNSTNAIVSGPNSTTPYLNLTWNYNNTIINPDQTIPITLTLSVTNSSTFTRFLKENDVTNFSFDITISATEQNEQ